MLPLLETVRALALELEYTLSHGSQHLQKEDLEVLPWGDYVKWDDSMIMTLLNITDMLQAMKTRVIPRSGFTT